MKSYLISAAIAALSLNTVNVAIAQDVPAELADGWKFMQQEMPGVPADLLKDACKEANLTVYHGTWSDAQKALISAFNKRFSCITVTRFELPTGALRERYFSEARAGRYIADIVQDTDRGMLAKEIADGLLTEYKISNDSAYPDAVKQSGYWYSMANIPLVIAWNSTIISDEEGESFKNWQALTDPKWKDKFGLVDPALGATAYLPVYVWLSVYGDDFLTKIAAQNIRLFGGTNASAAALASGEIALTVSPENGPFGMWSAGAPVKWVMPEPSIFLPTAQGIAAKAPHLNAAKLFQEYTFTKEGHGVFQVLGGTPTRTDVTDQRKVAHEPWYGISSDYFNFDQSDVDNPERRKEIYDKFHKQIGAFR